METLHVERSSGVVVAIASQIVGLATFSIVFGLVSLSDLYVAATPAAQRAALATTAEGLIAQYNTVSVGGILVAIGILVISLVMLKGVSHIIMPDVFVGAYIWTLAS